MNLNLYEQSGSGNHGCEAIIRSTIEMFKNSFSDINLFSEDIASEKKYKLDNICNVYKQGEKVKPYSFEHIFGKIVYALNQNYSPFYNKIHCNYLKSTGISLQTGGDNYCYGTQYKNLGYMNDETRRRGMKSILWGVSIEPDIIAIKGVAENLKRYDLITVRETITKDALERFGVKDNVVLVADPAFTLKKANISIHDKYKDAIGINISPLIMRREKKQGQILNSCKKLVEYILENTDKNILLIPHVVEEGNDDRASLKLLLNEFMDNERIIMLDDYNCMELKTYISQCSFFIGARTHATIAAYSTCVPTLVIGYSVKARGIAKDIFENYEEYVLPAQEIENSVQLVNAFKNLYNKKEQIREYLERKMPNYIQRAYKGRDVILKMIK